MAYFKKSWVNIPNYLVSTLSTHLDGPKTSKFNVSSEQFIFFLGRFRCICVNGILSTFQLFNWKYRHLFLFFTPHSQSVTKPVILIPIYLISTFLFFSSNIQQCMKRITYHDPLRFMPGLQGWFNFRKSTNVIHQINKLKEKP